MSYIFSVDFFYSVFFQCLFSSSKDTPLEKKKKGLLVMYKGTTLFEHLLLTAFNATNLKCDTTDFMHTVSKV